MSKAQAARTFSVRKGRIAGPEEESRIYSEARREGKEAPMRPISKNVPTSPFKSAATT